MHKSQKSKIRSRFRSLPGIATQATCLRQRCHEESDQDSETTLLFYLRRQYFEQSMQCMYLVGATPGAAQPSAASRFRRTWTRNVGRPDLFRNSLIHIYKYREAGSCAQSLVTCLQRDHGQRMSRRERPVSRAEARREASEKGQLVRHAIIPSNLVTWLSCTTSGGGLRNSKTTMSQTSEARSQDDTICDAIRAVVFTKRPRSNLKSAPK